MGFVAIPVIPRTMRPSVAGTPVWYAETTTARTQLDINITIPTGPSRKLILLWGSDGGEFPSAVTFDPAGAAIPMIPIDGAFGEIGSLRVGAYYLDAPPTGAKVVRIAATNAVWSVASLKVYQNARAGLPQSASASEAVGAGVSTRMDESLLLDAYSESVDMVLGDGLSDGNFTPENGQTAGADGVVNASFLATTSTRTHKHNGSVVQGWTAAFSADLLQAVVNILFSTGQIAAGAFQPLSVWDFNETSGTTFADSEGRSNTALLSGVAAGGADPLLNDGGTSLSVQGATIIAGHHVDWQVPSWSAEIYLQPRAWPSAGTVDAILGKDTGLPVPGGWQVEVEDDGAIDFYIRDTTGLAGSAIFVTTEGGQGTLTLDTAHVIHLTYNDETKTASIYLDRSLLASKTDQNFSGLENNSTGLSIGCRFGAVGGEFDGIIDRVTFGAGVWSAAEIAARPAPVTITDPDAPGAIVAVADAVGSVAPSTTTDVDVLANDTNKTGPHYDIEIVSDPAGRLSVINDQTASARIRITTPAAPSSTTLESGTYRVREGTSPTFGNPSNQATISWQRQAQAGGGGYAPFPFVTSLNPPVSHSGVSNRPGYSPTNPLSAAVTDPMSGIPIIRVGGNFNSTVFINGTTNSGLVFPHVLRNENSGTCAKVWNVDGSLLMIDRYYSESGDPGNSVRSYLIDATGTHGASVAWRIVRASSDIGLGDGVGQWWFWDPLNPLRAYVIRDDGSVDEWWPIGGSGHSVGEVNNLYGPVSGFPGWTTGSGRHNLFCSFDGQYYTGQCYNNSTQRWGGRRRNLLTGALGPFVQSPDSTDGSSFSQHPDRGSRGTSPSGRYTGFSPNGAFHRYYDVTTGAFV